MSPGRLTRFIKLVGSDSRQEADTSCRRTGGAGVRDQIVLTVN